MTLHLVMYLPDHMQAFGFAYPAVQSALWLKQQNAQQAGECSDNSMHMAQLAQGNGCES